MSWLFTILNLIGLLDALWLVGAAYARRCNVLVGDPDKPLTFCSSDVTGCRLIAVCHCINIAALSSWMPVLSDSD